jgi:hypothetical protein
MNWTMNIVGYSILKQIYGAFDRKRNEVIKMRRMNYCAY